ncbi:S8 family peptidase [Longimicrobium sp.]|uniref:S8 family peptidase n=1 Tax=Longimicrobium sp. TaxID=2029185 RepID=UPI003B3A80CA
MPEQLRGTDVVFETRLLANYLAGSHHPAELIRAAGFELVGSRNSPGRLVTRDSEETYPTKTLLLAGPDESYTRLMRLVGAEPEAAAPRFWESMVRVDEMRLAPPEDVIRSRVELGTGEVFTWEAVLHPVRSRSVNASRELRSVLAKWEALVRSEGGAIDLDDVRTVDGMSFIPVSLAAESLSRVARFNPLRCIRIMPKVRPLRVPVTRAVDGPFELTPPDERATPRSATRIAIFDGGVDESCPFVRPFVRQFELSPEPPEDEDVAHGAAVTTTTLYGYVRADATVPRPDVFVDHFRVLPLPYAAAHGPDDIDRELYWLLGEIEREVRAGDYALVNLSVGPRMAVDEAGEPDAWTSTLDALAREKRVLFVTAAGNDGHLDAESGLHRVQVPADMVNGLGVGACVDRDGRQVVRASYSSQGPGRWGARVQPAGVAFGGVLPSAPFVGVLPHGALGIMEGTSFAAPLVTHGLTGLLAEIGPTRASPELLRAFAIHHATRSTRNHDLNQIGYGRFRERYDDVWVGARNSVTVVYEDRLNREGVAGLRLPVPAGLPADAQLELWWTLCITAPIAPRDAVEYTMAGCEVLFRPHRYRYSFNDPARNNKKMGEADIREERDLARSFIRQGYVQSRMPVSKSAPRMLGREQGRREGGKWETVVQQRFSRLEARTLIEPTIELNYIARDGGVIKRDVDALPYAMLVTVSTRATVDLYGLVSQQFPLLAPIQAQVQLRV